MSRIRFGPDQPLMRALGMVGDFVLLNLLFLLCSLPIVTIGQAASALDSVMQAIIQKREGQIVRDYLAAFRRDLGKGVVIWVAALAVLAGIYVDIRVMQANPAAFSQLLRAPVWILGAVVLMSVPVVFFVHARYENSLWNTVKNGVALTVVHPLRAVLAAVVSFLAPALFLFATYYLIYSSLWWFLGGFSVASWLRAKLLLPCCLRREQK